MSAVLATLKQTARVFDGERRTTDGVAESDYALVSRMGAEGRIVVITSGEAKVAKKYRAAIERADAEDMILTVVDPPEATPADAHVISRKDAKDTRKYEKAKAVALATGVALLIASEDEPEE